VEARSTRRARVEDVALNEVVDALATRVVIVRQQPAAVTDSCRNDTATSSTAAEFTGVYPYLPMAQLSRGNVFCWGGEGNTFN